MALRTWDEPYFLYTRKAPGNIAIGPGYHQQGYRRKRRQTSGETWYKGMDKTTERHMGRK